MDKLLQPSCQISGEIFYITDGDPTTLNFLTNPLKKFIIDKDKRLMPYDKLTSFEIKVPKRVALIYALGLSYLSTWAGRKFTMPSWGFTYMELKKVIQNFVVCI
jgi:hypothetical protein